jgi:hypothetical protein
MTSRTKWPRVPRDNLCPICGKPDCCLIEPDGEAEICALSTFIAAHDGGDLRYSPISTNSPTQRRGQPVDNEKALISIWDRFVGTPANAVRPSRGQTYVGRTKREEVANAQ